MKNIFSQDFILNKYQSIQISILTQFGSSTESSVINFTTFTFQQLIFQSETVKFVKRILNLIISDEEKRWNIQDKKKKRW